MNLIKYRDAGMHTYTYFWTRDERVASPYFNTEVEAFNWLESIADGGDKVSTWRDSRDGNTVGDDRKSSKSYKCK